MAALKSRLMQPDLVKVFAETFIAEANSLRAAQAQQLREWASRSHQIERRIQKLVEAISQGVPPQARLEELRRLEAEQEEIQARLETSPKDPPPLLHPNRSEIYRRKVAELHKLLEDPDTCDEATAAIRSLIHRVVVTPDGEQLCVDLHGELATILQFASVKQKPAAEIRDGLTQIKLVAGVGFEPTTFRL